MPQPTPEPTTEEVRECIHALPPTNDGPLITWTVAAAAFFELTRRQDSTIPRNIQAHSRDAFGKVVAELEPVPGTEGTFVITADQLRGALSRIATLAAAQTAWQLGQGVIKRNGEIKDLSELFNLTVDGSNGEHSPPDQAKPIDTEEDPPAA